jgi:hypothetical protein
MSILIGAGQRYDRIIGVGGITTSTDGYLWSSESNISQPFPSYMKAQGVVANGSGNVFVSISDSGWAATSTDLVTWQAEPLLDANFTALGVSWGLNGSGARPIFAIAGSRIYNDHNTLPGEYELNDQIAQILINESGSPYTWDQAFTHPYPNSWFHNVRYFTDILVNDISTNVWIAVGHVNGQPDIWYTEDVNWDIITGAPDTNTWEQVSIPSSFVNRPLYDVAVVNGTLYFSGRGVVINTADLGNPTWNASPFFNSVSARINSTGSMLLGEYYNSTTNITLGTNFTSATSIAIGGGAPSNQLDFINIASNTDGHLAAVSSGMIIFTKDRIGWTSYSANGYFFRSIIWFIDHWVAGAYSNLTQYTYWTSTDGTTWLPWNNGVQMYGMYGSNTVTVASAGSTFSIASSSDSSIKLSNTMINQSMDSAKISLSRSMR